MRFITILRNTKGQEDYHWWNFLPAGLIQAIKDSPVGTSITLITIPEPKPCESDGSCKAESFQGGTR